MHPLFIKGKDLLITGDYLGAKNCFSELMHSYEEVPFNLYPQILEYLHLTLTLEMVSYFQKCSPEVANKVHDYLLNNTSYKEHFSQPDFQLLENILNADSL